MIEWTLDSTAYDNGKLLPWARAWYNLRKRLDPKWLSTHLTYTGCRVCKSWHTASNFKSWYDSYYVKGYCLDKDLLGNGKIYSPESCCYIPQWLNTLLCDCRASRGDLPQGVSRNRHNYRALLSVDGNYTTIGTYKTPAAAFEAYATAKREYVHSKQQAILDLHRGDEIWKGVIRILESQLTNTVS